MPRYIEGDIELAILDVESGLSQRQAALRNGIPRSTLSERLNGRRNSKIAHEHRQKITPEQEANLEQ